MVEFLHVLTPAFGFPGLLALVGTSWYGHRIAKEFYDPFTPTNSRWVLLPTAPGCTWRHWADARPFIMTSLSFDDFNVTFSQQV